jgi:hypothetical protein
MLEFRKDLFADERDDDLNEIGKPTQRHVLKFIRPDFFLSDYF